MIGMILSIGTCFVLALAISLVVAGSVVMVAPVEGLLIGILVILCHYRIL